jgi:hypothetical protein
MALMQDVMQALRIKPETIPANWETYFIAALDKYAKKARNRERYQSTWYRENATWLSLAQEPLEALTDAADTIGQNLDLYRWSSFVRYLIADTLIIKNDETWLDRLIPHDFLTVQADLFLPVTLIAHLDHPIEIYLEKGVSNAQVKRNFYLIDKLLETYKARAGYYGIRSGLFIDRLFRSGLYVFSGIGYEYKTINLPGKIYRNVKSGEVLMVADPGQLFDAKGYRLSREEEEKLLKANEKSKVLVDEKTIEDNADSNSDLVRISQKFPEGIWDSKFYHTESGGFVANNFDKNGSLQSMVRIFDRGQWEELITDETPILEVYIADEESFSLETFRQSLKEALDFLEKQGKSVHAIFLSSFLLDPSYLAKLEDDDDLNILADRLRRFSVPYDRTQVLEKLFPGQDLDTNPLNWETRTPVQENVRQLLIEDLGPRTFASYLLEEDWAPLIEEDEDEEA